MEKKTVVLYPGVGIGHLAPMLELAKAFLRHGGGAFDVAVALVEPPVRDPGFSAAVARAKASNTSVAFHVLPPPPPTDGDGEQGHRMARMLRFLRAMNAPLRDFLRSLPSLSVGSSVQALVLDMFLRRKARRRRRAWPARLLLLRLGRDRPRRLPRTARRAGQHGHRLHGARRRRPLVPGRSPVQSIGAALVGRRRRRGVQGHPPHGCPDAGCPRGPHQHLRVSGAARGARSQGRAVRPRPPARRRSTASGRSCREAAATRSTSASGGWTRSRTAASCSPASGAWARSPRTSSRRSPLVIGLESSGQRFHWVVRSPRGSGETPADDIDALLPAGFLEWTKGRGLVVSSWAPQADVLRHRAAGEFVTHCGWNSTLKGVAAGLPLLCWPLYAEQKLNKVWVVEEMKLGVEMNRSCSGDGDDVVDEVEAKVRWAMESGLRRRRETEPPGRSRKGARLMLLSSSSSRIWRLPIPKPCMANVRVHL